MSKIIRARHNTPPDTQIVIHYDNGREIAIPALKTDPRYKELIEWVRRGNTIEPYGAEDDNTTN